MDTVVLKVLWHTGNLLAFQASENVKNRAPAVEVGLEGKNMA